MDFDGAHGDAEVAGDHLVHLAGQHALHHFDLALRELGDALIDGLCGGALRQLLLMHGQRGQRTVHQFVVVERLLDEIEGALLDRAHRHRHVAVAGQEDDRHVVAVLVQPAEQFEPAHAVHADVQQQTAAVRDLAAGDQRLGRGPGAHCVAARTEQPAQRVADGFVVVDDEDLAHRLTPRLAASG
jgi:hypothetical protein